MKEKIATIVGAGALAAAAVICLVPAAQAGNDPSIKGKLREDIGKAMNGFFAEQTVDGVMRVYDPVDGKLLKLKLDSLHSGIVKKGDFYVSCADFRDQDDRKIDLDVLVIEAGKGLKATQGIVHSVEGKKRPYHLED